MKNVARLFIVLFVLHASVKEGFSQVTGSAFLTGQSDHSEIKVKFLPNSMTAVLDSVLTIADGSYSINLSGGLYEVLFSKTGYQDVYYDNGNILAIANTDVLTDVTLQIGTAIYVSDTVFGNWTNDNDYIISGDIIIPTDSTLWIEAGTSVKFDGYYSITANGILNAIGSENDPIIITSNLSTPNAGDWHNIEINNSECVIDHCIIEYGTYGFNFSNSSPSITNNEIRNIADGGIYCLNGSPLISGNTIHNFNGMSSAWGIWVEGFGSSATIECNTIYDGLGYGIMTKSDNTVQNNEIYNITGSSRGKGIYVSNQCVPLVENNYVHNCRIGIDIGNSVNSMPNPKIVNNTIHDNSYAGIYFNNFYANGTVINNIVFNNGYGIKQDVSFSTTPDTVSSNLVWNNANGDIVDVQITGIGQIVTTNSNGDAIDSYFNLAQDPMFESNTPPVLGTTSPCINAGDTSYSANMGFDTSFICEEVVIPVGVGDIEKELAEVLVYPNPFSETATIEVKLQGPSSYTLEIFNIMGQRVDIIQGTTSQAQTISRGNLPSGVYPYLLRIKGEIKGAGKLIIAAEY